MTKTVERCPACQSREHGPRFRTRDRLHGVDGEFVLHRCRQCGLQFLSPMPSAEELTRYYVPEYTPYNRRTKDWRDRLEVRIHRGLNSDGPKRILYAPLEFLVRRGLPVKPGQRILDIGCGSGNYLRMARRLGASCHGTDIFTGRADTFSEDGITFHGQRAEDLDFDDGFFDVITINHVLEHLHDPGAVLKNVARQVGPGGRIIIQVPNGRSLVALLFGPYYMGIESPRHLYVFSRKNLELLCRTGGLAIEKVFYRTPVTVNIFMLSLVFFLEEHITGGKPSTWIRTILGNILLRALLFPLGIVLGLLRVGDGLELYLVRNGNTAVRGE